MKLGELGEFDNGSRHTGGGAECLRRPSAPGLSRGALDTTQILV